MKPFVHLHNHSHYSMLDGAQNIDTMVSRAKELGMNALAITDHGVLHGALKFYKECRLQGVKPIIGYEAYICDGSRRDKIAGSELYHLTVLAKNNTGWKNLIRLASTASIDGFYYKPRIDHECLQEFRDGLIILSGCVSSQLSHAVLNDDFDNSYEIAAWFSNTFGSDFYLELMNNGTNYQERATNGIIQVSNKMGIPSVATADCHYTMPDDWDLQDMMICISTGRPISSPIESPRMSEKCYYLRTPEEMYSLLPHAACEMSQAIADIVDIEITTGVRHFPVFDVPVFPGHKVTPETHIRALCADGLYRRGISSRADGAQPYWDRLRRELKVIHDLGFDEYFLIIADFVEWARARGIRSTARGSGVGSLVSFCLGISHVDPIEHGLLFERFLDPSRKEAPDIDVDIDKERRPEVIQYVKDKYGEQCVAQIGTFGTLAAKSAVKEVGKCNLIQQGKIVAMVDSIPELPGTTLEDAYDRSEELRSLIEGDERVRQTFEMAKRIEGMSRSSGVHAAGVVIGDRDLQDYVPLMVGKEGGTVTQWDMDDCEAIGLLKMDFLGLRNLTIITKAIDIIEQSRGYRLDINKTPMNDPEVFSMLARGECKGVFQLESGGMTGLLMRLNPSNVEHICACIALYRPGPLDAGMVEEYVNVKNGKQPATYAHPAMEEILGYTYGVMVYQEQVMKVLNMVGNISLSESYSCIKAISKKKKDKVLEYKKIFIDGCGTTCDGESIWEQIVTFARYGFNKSHSMAYAHIAYQTAWLKCHYPIEFMAALLEADIDQRNYTGRDILCEHIDDARRMGIQIVMPDVNVCGPSFTVRDGKIIFGLDAVKGVPHSAGVAIANAQPFKDLFDFCRRVPKSACPRAAIRNLIRIGSMPGPYAIDIQEATIDRAMKVAEGSYKNPSKQDGKWSQCEIRTTKLQSLEYERELTGMYINGHPIIESYPDLALIGGVSAYQNDEGCVLAGVITTIETRHTVSSGKMFMTFIIDSPSGSTECMLWDPDAGTIKELQDGRVVVVRGNVSNRGGSSAVNVRKIYHPSSYLSQHQPVIGAIVDSPERAKTACQLFEQFPGNNPSYIVTDTHRFRTQHLVGQPGRSIIQSLFEAGITPVFIEETKSANKIKPA